MASEAEINEYEEEMKSHFKYYATAKEIRAEMGIPKTLPNHTHKDDVTWSAIKKSAKAIIESFNLDSDQRPTVEEQLAIANKIATSEPLKSLCDKTGKNPRYFTSWLIYSVLRSKSISRRSKVRRQDVGEGGSGRDGSEGESGRDPGDRESGDGKSSRDVGEGSSGAASKGFSIGNLLN